MIAANGLSSGKFSLIAPTQEAITRGDDAGSKKLMVNYLKSGDFLGMRRDIDDLTASLNNFTIRLTCDFGWSRILTSTGAIEDHVTITRVAAYVP